MEEEQQDQLGQEDTLREQSPRNEHRGWKGLNAAMGIAGLASMATFLPSVTYDSVAYGDARNEAKIKDQVDDVDPLPLQGFTFEGLEQAIPDQVKDFYEENKEKLDGFEELPVEEKRDMVLKYLEEDLKKDDSKEVGKDSHNRAAASFLASVSFMGALVGSESLRRYASRNRK